MTTVLEAEIPIGTDRSAKVLRAEVWKRSFTSGCGSFVLLFENQDKSLTGVFSPQNTVLIKVNNGFFIKGYVDTIKHIVYDREDIFLHLLRVSGRDYSQDAQNLTHTESYSYNTRIDDLIEDALSDAGAEITYTSGHSESQIAGGFEAKDDYLLNIFRECMERESYDAYVDPDKALQLTDLSNPTSSTIALKCVAGAADNNIFATQPIEYTVADGLPIKNYIKLIGQRVRDGWTDGNGSDWTPGTNTLLTDSLTKKAGARSIRGHLTWDGVNAVHFYLDFSGGLYSKTANYLDWSIYGNEEMMWWARCGKVGATSVYCLPRLKDTTGNVIDYQDGHITAIGGLSADTWYWLGAPVGTECSDIKVGYTDNKWHWITNVDGNFTWKIERVGFWSVVPGVDDEHFQDDLYIDDMRLPEEMVSITSDAGSIASYRQREVPIRKPYYKTQLELDDCALAVKAILKAPFKYLKLQTDGNAGIIALVNKWMPTHTLTVNIPDLGINTETWRMMNVHHIVEPRVDLDGQGHDFITEVELVPQSNKVIGFIFDALTSGRVEPVIGSLDERMRSQEKRPSRSHLDVTTRGDEAT